MRTIVLGLVLGFLFLGCVGEAPGTPSAPLAEPTTGGPAAGGGEPPAAPAGLNLEGMGYMELAALGIPVECDVSVTDGETGEVVTSRMYIQGENLRVEPEISTEVCEGPVIITNMDENAMYTGCSGGQGMMPGCPWIEITIEPGAMVERSAPSTSDGEEDADLETIPASSFSCRIGTFGAEKFRPDGHACNLEEMMGGN